LPYAAWRRWVRLQLAMDVVRAGDSLTEAAHAAGVGATAHPNPTHPGAAAGVGWAVDRPGGPPRLAELAARVGISASRLSHVFTEQVGLPYAAWRRWVRLQLAMDVVRAGDSLTEAAHAAGFADSAHLTRTCRDLIGISPTEALIATGWRPPSAKVS
ncbi:helix-turn-helix transcriptional regulator, partial [Nocardia farcinica]|uniref:helix-turn-helix transcriptional regulator n=1 Tax=Nocardia farcinica TaxID=37329 RepID=UPI002453AB50